MFKSPSSESLIKTPRDNSADHELALVREPSVTTETTIATKKRRRVRKHREVKKPDNDNQNDKKEAKPKTNDDEHQ